MDPNQWAYNQAYRINAAAAGGIPTNFPLIEQAAPSVQGTGVLPTHPSLAQPRGLGAIPAVNYGHPAFGTVSQFLDTMSSLAAPIASTSGPYKAVTVGQPAYSLDSPPRSTEPRLLATPTNPVTSVSPPKSWELSSFIPTPAATSNPFSGLPSDLATTAAFNSTLQVEPPPAHSRNPISTRASTIQRNPYQKDFMDPALLPVTAHSGSSRTNNQSVSSYSSLPEQREPPVAHSHGSQFCSYGPGSQLNSGNQRSGGSSSHQSPHLSSHQSSNSSSMRTSGMTSNFPSSPQLPQQQQQQQHQPSIQETYSYGRGISNNTFVDSAKLIDASPSLSYEARQPPPPSMSSHTSTTWASSQPAVHQPLKVHAAIPPSHKQQESQSTLSSPHSHIGSPHMVPSQSPLHQPSPNNHTNVGSPQVSMSLGSPQQSASSTVAPPPMPVQAVPDSTTRPRKRHRKKKDESHKASDMPLTPYESSAASLQQPVFAPSGDLTFSYPKYTPSPIGYGGPENNGEGAVFMTNAFGNSFVNPNDTMGAPAPPLKVESQMDYADQNMGMSKSNLDTPSAAAAQEEVDEEFAHLVSPPPKDGGTSTGTSGGASSAVNNASTSKPPELPQQQQQQQMQQPEQPPASTEKSPPKSSSAFQNSFLSFIQGNKPETLSSVTNANIQRPPMPKYVPDNRPIIPPEPKFRSRSDDEDDVPLLERKRKRRSDMDVPSVTFSDDEDMNDNKGRVSKTVENFLNMDDEVIGHKRHLHQVARRGKGKGSIRMKGSRGHGSKKRKSSGWDEDDDFEPIDLDDDDIIEEISPKVSKKKGRSPSPVLMRERPSRRAKDKVEEKRRQKEEKKKTKIYVGSGSEISSGDEVEPIEKDYDSDRDPVWRPSALPDFVPVHNDSDDDGTGRKGKGKGKKFRIMPQKLRGRGRPMLQTGSYMSTSPTTMTSSSSSSYVKPTPDDPGANPVPEPVHLPSDDDEEPVHRFLKGDFVIEKKDLTNYDSYPIWKIDAGRLIQKFESTEQNGRIIHKALSTYSSWSDAIKHQFKAIKVRILQVGRAVGTEQVEVLEPFRPQPPDAMDEEEDELMPFFNIYMQILISQALEPGFLAAINEEKDEYYHGPLKRVDAIIEDSIKELEKVLRWKDIFKDHVCLYPDSKVLERTNVTMPCQITTNTPAPIANRAILLAGEAYEPETLEPLPAKTQAKREYLCNITSIRHLATYHGLKHYRHKTYQNCLQKVLALKEANSALENRDLLDQCLQNRQWVQKMFRDLKNLTRKANTSTTTAT